MGKQSAVLLNPASTRAKICLDVPVRGGLESCKHLGEALGRAVCPRLRASRRWGTWLEVGCICKENSITKFEMRSAENVGRASKLRRTKIAQSVLTHPGSTGAAWDATTSAAMFSSPKYCFKKWVLSP